MLLPAATGWRCEGAAFSSLLQHSPCGVLLVFLAPGAVQFAAYLCSLGKRPGVTLCELAGTNPSESVGSFSQFSFVAMLSYWGFFSPSSLLVLLSQWSSSLEGFLHWLWERFQLKH